jgi:periplasmic protein TonB
MSSASLAVVQHSHPDRARIASISAAIALNLAVIVVASRPIISTQPLPGRSAHPVPLIRLVVPPEVVPAPPPVLLKPLPHPAPAPQHLRHATIQPPAVVPIAEGQVAITPDSVALRAVPNAPGNQAVSANPVEASLAYRLAPLRFPTEAMRQHMQGTVLLRVLVDPSGKPLKVEVENSSGYPLLDHSAREQVLAAWRFQPAMVDGRAVRAWARVPVTFALQER